MKIEKLRIFKLDLPQDTLNYINLACFALPPSSLVRWIDYLIPLSKGGVPDPRIRGRGLSERNLSSHI